MIVKIVYFVAIAFTVWGGWMFHTDMNPLLETNFIVSCLILALLFYVWGRYVFRPRVTHE